MKMNRMHAVAAWLAITNAMAPDVLPRRHVATDRSKRTPEDIAERKAKHAEKMARRAARHKLAGKGEGAGDA